jgi:hypothetical protein
MNIQEIRQKYPQYNDMSDSDLATALHAKHYSDVPFTEFSSKIGLEGIPQAKPMDAPDRGGFKPGMLRKTLSYGPEVGGAVGGMFGPPGAALGGAFGEGVEVLGETAMGDIVPPGEAAKRMAWEGAKQGALDYGGGKIVKGLTKLAAPAKDAMTKGGRRIMSLAEDAGLPVSVSRLAPSRLNKMFQWGADFTHGGKLVSDHYRSQILDKATDAANTFTDAAGLAKIGKSELSEGLGENIAKIDTFDQAYSDWNRILGTIAAEDKQAGKKVSELFVDGANTEMDSAIVKIMDDEGLTRHQAKVMYIEETFGFKPRSQEGLLLSRLADNDVIDVQDFQTLMRKIWGGDKRYSKLPKFVSDNREKLKGLLLKDVDSAAKNIGLTESAEKAKMAGDAVFADVKEYLKRSPNVRQIIQPSWKSPGKMRFQVDPDDMVNNLITKGGPEELLELKGRLLGAEPIEGIMSGKEAWAGFEYNYIQDLINKSMREMGEAKNLRFSPGEFARQFKEKEAVIKEVFPNSYNKIKDFSDLMENAAKDFDALGEKSFVKEGLRLGVDIGGFGVPSGFGALTSWGMMTPSSKNWLKKYFSRVALSMPEKTLLESGKIAAKTGVSKGLGDLPPNMPMGKQNMWDNPL